MDMDQKLEVEAADAFEWLMHRYGDRIAPDMEPGLRTSVEGVVKTVVAVRKVPLANGEAPLLGFTPGAASPRRQDRHGAPREL